MKFHKKFLVGAAVLVTALPLGSAIAAEIADTVKAECGACHQLEGPAQKSLTDRQERKGPPLYYAGNKFRGAWLAKWLHEPTRLRPAGDFPPGHVKVGANGDEVDSTSLAPHPALAPETAQAVADYLMTLKPHDDLIGAEDYTPGGISSRMGEMDFVKFKGCGACHKDTPKYGGVSGPELYTAWQRLQPSFIVSYIRNPTAWDPRSLMPAKNLQTGAIHKLSNYLKLIGEKGGTAK